MWVCTFCIWKLIQDILGFNSKFAGYLKCIVVVTCTRFSVFLVGRIQIIEILVCLVTSIMLLSDSSLFSNLFFIFLYFICLFFGLMTCCFSVIFSNFDKLSLSIHESNRTGTQSCINHILSY